MQLERDCFFLITRRSCYSYLPAVVRVPRGARTLLACTLTVARTLRPLAQTLTVARTYSYGRSHAVPFARTQSPSAAPLQQTSNDRPVHWSGDALESN
jgi:hypothetical protein